MASAQSGARAERGAQRRVQGQPLQQVPFDSLRSLRDRDCSRSLSEAKPSRRAPGSHVPGAETAPGAGAAAEARNGLRPERSAR